MRKITERGFTLVELIVIIVVLGITLPMVVMPFITAATALSLPGDTSRLLSVTRGQMEKETARLDDYWPSVADAGFLQETFTRQIDGRQYTTTITRRFVNASLAETDGNPLTNSNRYLLLSVTGTDQNEYSLKLTTVKTRDY